MDLKVFRATLPNALRFLRSKAGLTQERLAEAAGITPSMVSNYERGKEKPGLDTLVKLLTALQSDFGELHDALYVLTEHWTPEARKRRRKAVRVYFYHLLEEKADKFTVLPEGFGEEDA